MSPSVKATCVGLGFLLFFCDYARSLIVPEEIPTLLSLVYSNIPPIKTGSDSRTGIGFRLGEHADVQFIIEIGPQINTETIGVEESKRRRDVMLGAAMKGEMGPWAQAIAKYQTEYRIQKELERLKRFQAKLSRTKGAEKGTQKKIESNDWLNKWSNEMLKPEKDEKAAPIKIAGAQRIRVLATDKAKDKNDSHRISGSAENPVEQLNKLFQSATNATE